MTTQKEQLSMQISLYRGGNSNHLKVERRFSGRFFNSNTYVKFLTDLNITTSFLEQSSDYPST